MWSGTLCPVVIAQVLEAEPARLHRLAEHHPRKLLVRRDDCLVDLVLEEAVEEVVRPGAQLPGLCQCEWPRAFVYRVEANERSFFLLTRELAISACAILSNPCPVQGTA